jgi:hypothetical protein
MVQFLELLLNFTGELLLIFKFMRLRVQDRERQD